MATENSQYARMPAQKVSVEIGGAVDPRSGVVEKRILLDARGVTGNALTTTDVMIPNVPSYSLVAATFPHVGNMYLHHLRGKPRTNQRSLPHVLLPPCHRL